jgi:opine dehydrogenase
MAGLLPRTFAAIEVADDVRGAVSAADLIFVAERLRDHPAIHALLAKTDTRAGVVLVPGGVGGALAFSGLGLAFVAELPGFPFLADYDGQQTLSVRAIKRGLPLGVLPLRQSPTALSALGDIVPDASPSASVLETSFANTNVLIHPPLVLANWPRVEAGAPFTLYREGLTPAGARLIERVDAERLAIATAFGLPPVALPDLLRRFYADQGMRGTDVAEMLRTFPPFDHSPGPTSPGHRYLTDDVPFGLVPLAELAQAAGVPAPTINGLVDVLDGLCGTDLRAAGRSLDQMGLAGLDAAAIVDRATGASC